MKHTAQEYLKMIAKNPEDFGTTAAHISKVNSTIKKLEATEETARAKRERKSQGNLDG